VPLARVEQPSVGHAVGRHKQVEIQVIDRRRWVHGFLVERAISWRVIRMLCQRRYLVAGIDAAMTMGYDPLRDNEPEFARTMAASVTQRIAFGERVGQHVRRMRSGFGYEGEHPVLTGTRCASVDGFSLHATTQVPAHRRDQLERLLRYTARGPWRLSVLRKMPMETWCKHSQSRGLTA
jgi:hypothetical protein